MFRFARKLVEELNQDVSFSFRQLGKYPLYSAIVIATFAVGIAANTAIFSVMDAIVLRPLAVPDLDRVVSVAEQRRVAGGQGASAASDGISFADFVDFCDQSRSFAQLAARTSGEMTLTGISAAIGVPETGESESVRVVRATTDLFSLYRIAPMLGRSFGAGEDTTGHDGEVVLTYAFWKTHFGGRPDAVGNKMELDGRTYTVIGVMPHGFDHVAYSDVWLPLALNAEQQRDRASRNMTVVGRLQSGATLASATQELDVIAAEIARQSPGTNQGWVVKMRPLLETVNGDYTPQYTRVILFATLLLMVVVCANISNLQFARAATGW